MIKDSKRVRFVPNYKALVAFRSRVCKAVEAAKCEMREIN